MGAQVARRRARAGDQAVRDFVEEFAIHMETEGLPRMAGRILGALLVCEPPEKTAAELAHSLHASSGSVSTMTRLLLRADLIERVSLPGERADRFRAKPMSALMHGATQRVRRLRELTERGLAALADRKPAARARLQSVHDLYQFFETNMPTFIERWERQNGGGR